MDEKATGIMDQLNGISESINGLRESVLYAAPLVDPEMQEKMTRIWSIAQQLERQFAMPEVIGKCRQDATEQICRVYQLIGEADIPDDRQLLSIGLAFELAQEKIKTYSYVSGMAAKRAVLDSVAGRG